MKISVKRPCRFTFRHYDAPFSAAITDDADGRARLSVTGVLGYLPYTAETPAGRARLLEACANPATPLSITQAQEIVLVGESDLAGDDDIIAAIAETVRMVIAAKPALARCAALFTDTSDNVALSS